jgi:1A family penicillin-binding protein
VWSARVVVLVVLLLLATSTLVAASIVVGTGIATAYAFNLLTRNLPPVSTIGSIQLPETTMIYDRNGVLLYEVVDPKEGKRTSIPLSEVPVDLIKATIAVEDASFFENPGVDGRAIGRALLGNFQAGRVTSGASTITQQLVKNSLGEAEETYTRKLREAVMAYRLSRGYSKEQLLELYLNQNNYGNHSYGVEAAAEAYFNKKASELNLAECSMLAGLPQAPSVYNPVVNLPAAKQRQREVLDAMVLHGLLDQASADSAFATPLLIKPSETEIKAPQFVFYVLDELVKRFGHEAVYRGGLRVITSLDYGLQVEAERIAQQQVEAVKSHNVSDAAVVAINPKTGEIVVMLGSADYNNDSISGKFNVALARRQPGSSIKPMTYAAAFEKGWSPSTVIVDAKTEFPPRQGDTKPYTPANYDEKVHGPLSVRKALGNSMNIPAVKALMFVGIPDMIGFSRRMGITTFDRGTKECPDTCVYGLSLTLGGGEVRLLDITSAYGVFAAGGVRHPPIAWRKVTDRYGKVLDEMHPERADQVISPQVAFLMTSVLSDDKARELEFGTNSGLKLSRPAAAKTGTTDAFRDNWTIGYTPNLVTGVWVGNANNDKMNDIIGITGAGPIWHDFMEEALRPLPVENFVIPPGIVKERVSDLTGMLVTSSGNPQYKWTVDSSGQRKFELVPGTGEPSHEDWFIQGSQPTRRTYRPGTYRAYWGTGQIAAANCPEYLIDVRVWGPNPPPPGQWDCARNVSTYNPANLPAGTVNPYAFPTLSPEEQAQENAATLTSTFPEADQTAIAIALSATSGPSTTPTAVGTVESAPNVTPTRTPRPIRSTPTPPPKPKQP